VKGKIPEVRFVVYGSVSVPEYFKVCQSLVRELSLEENFIFAGHVDDIPAAYRSGDVIVLTSITEAFPYSVVEAMMSGKAVVATDVGGIREALGEMESKITADGTAVRVAINIPEPKEKVPEEELDCRQIEQENKTGVIRFWDLDLEETEVVNLGREQEEIAVTRTPEAEEIVESEIDQENTAEDNEVPSREASQASQVVADEIASIRHRYIVGKLAGEDLYDLEGKLIIAKSSAITPETIEKAEKAGKLAELIVNMVIPGLGD
jgi:glycosyltransferase involved in cell wall biosynthesis